MREIWFDAVPEFVRGSDDCGCWAAIFEIDDCIRNFHPESFVEFCFCNDSLDSFHNRSICPFCNAVLVGTVRSCCLVNNTGSLEVKSHPFSYSPPPSVVNRLISFPVCFSTSGLYSLNFSNTSADDFFLRG